MTVLDQASPTEAVQSTVQEPASEPIDSEAVVAVVMDFVGATLRQLDHLLERMRLSPCGPGVTGSLFQWSRRTLDGVRVTEVWQSRQYFEITFREDIQPRLSGIGLPDPEITTYEVHSFLTQGPTVAQQREAWIEVSFEEAAVGRYPLRLKEVHVEDDDKVASPDQPSQLFAADDARVVVDFTVGPPGVGPVIGFDSDDFFSSAPDADIDRDRTD
jgi:hypothetical protein